MMFSTWYPRSGQLDALTVGELLSQCSGNLVSGLPGGAGPAGEPVFVNPELDGCGGNVSFFPAHPGVSGDLVLVEDGFILGVLVSLHGFCQEDSQFGQVSMGHLPPVDGGVWGPGVWLPSGV